MKRKIIILLTTMLMVFAMSQYAFADNLVSANSSNHSFSSPWQATKTTSIGGTNILTYGYDTSLINEDYAYAYSDGWTHRAKITNGSKTAYGPTVSATTGWSDLEIKHSGSYVSYWNVKVL